MQWTHLQCEDHYLRQVPSSTIECGISHSLGDGSLLIRTISRAGEECNRARERLELGIGDQPADSACCCHLASPAECSGSSSFCSL